MQMSNWLPRSQNLRLLSRKNAILLAMCGISLTVVVVLVIGKPEPDKRDVTAVSLPVTALAALPADHAPQLNLYGRVEAPRTSTLNSASSAYVAAVLLQEGEWVEVNEVLVQLDPIDAELLLARRTADYDDAVATVESLRITGDDNKAILAHERKLYALSLRKVERHKQLREQSSISAETLNLVLRESHNQAISLQRIEGLVKDHKHQLARAQAGRKRSEALQREASVALERTTIKAPFAGRITQMNVSPGEWVSPGMPVAELYDVANLEIRTQIPASHVGTLKRALANGVRLLAEVDGADGETTAELVRVSGMVSAGRPGVDGLFKVDNPALELGRTVNLRLALPPLHDVVKVPIQALYGQDRLFLVQNNELKGISVERLGNIEDADGQFNVLVRSNAMPSGSLVLTSKLTNAMTGLKVEVRTPPTSVPPGPETIPHTIDDGTVVSEAAVAQSGQWQRN